MPAHVVHECCIFRGNVSLVLRGVCLQENIYIFSTRKKRVERRPCSVKTNPRERCRQQLDGAALCKKKNTWSHPVRAPKAAVTSTSPGSSESQRTGKPLREGGGDGVGGRHDCLSPDGSETQTIPAVPGTGEIQTFLYPLSCVLGKLQVQ